MVTQQTGERRAGQPAATAQRVLHPAAGRTCRYCPQPRREMKPELLSTWHKYWGKCCLENVSGFYLCEHLTTISHNRGTTRLTLFHIISSHVHRITSLLKQNRLIRETV